MSKINGKELHEKIKKKLSLKRDKELADFSNITPQQISSYNKKDVSAETISNYIKKAYEKGKKEGRTAIKEGAIKKIIEYSPIVPDVKSSGFINPPRNPGRL